MQPPPQWARDPSGVFTHRWWDGQQWTDRVAIDGHEGSSPIDAPAAEAERTAGRLRPVPPPPGRTHPPPAPMAPVLHAHSYVPVAIGGRPVSSIGRRLGAHLLDMVLFFATCGIGWVIWGAFTAVGGATPGKHLLGMQCVRTDTGEPLDWATFVLLRGGIGSVGGLLASATVVGVVVYLLPFFNDYNQHFYGVMTHSTYVDV